MPTPVPTLSAGDAEHSGHRARHVEPRRRGQLRRDRRDRAQARLPPHRHRVEIRQRARRRRRHARVRHSARRHLPLHQGVARISARGRFRPLGRRKPRQSRRRLCRPAAGALAERRNPAEGNHGRAGQGQARRPRAPHRRGEFQHRAARRGDRALPGAAGQPAGRGPSLYRHDARSSTPAAHAASCSPPIARSGAGGCSTIRCWARSPRAKAARSRRWRCAGSCSAATSCRSRARRIPDALAENLDVFGFTLSDDEMARIGALKRANGRIANPPGRAPKWD